MAWRATIYLKVHLSQGIWGCSTAHQSGDTAASILLCEMMQFFCFTIPADFLSTTGDHSSRCLELQSRANNSRLCNECSTVYPTLPGFVSTWSDLGVDNHLTNTLSGAISFYSYTEGIAMHILQSISCCIYLTVDIFHHVLIVRTAERVISGSLMYRVTLIEYCYFYHLLILFIPHTHKLVVISHGEEDGVRNFVSGPKRQITTHRLN